MKTYNESRGATVVLSSTQLQNLQSAPIILIPAQGTGKIIIPLQVFYSYTYGTVQYTDTVILSPDNSGQPLNFNNSINMTDAVSNAGYLGSPEYYSALLPNSPMCILANGSMGNGDGTLTIVMFWVAQGGF